MIKRINEKINEYIENLLNKEALTLEEFNILLTVEAKLKADEQAVKWDAEKEERNQEIAALLAKTFKM